SSFNLYTDASSEVSSTTYKFSFLSDVFLGNLDKTPARTSGPILAAHPPDVVISVSFFIISIIMSPPFKALHN
ncbi:MAG: hypothetical protein ACLVIU_10080, partial [Paraclostridium sp.]